MGVLIFGHHNKHDNFVASDHIIKFSSRVQEVLLLVSLQFIIFKPYLINSQTAIVLTHS